MCWDRGDSSPDDDDLITVREVVDPGGLQGLGQSATLLFDTNAQRIEMTPRALWSSPQADPMLAGLTDGAMTFKVATISSWTQGVEHHDLPAEPDVLEQFAAQLGAQLAAMHLRAPSDSDRSGGEIIAADIGSRADLFVDELVRDVELDLRRVRTDHALFVQALELYGPVLGANRLGP